MANGKREKENKGAKFTREHQKFITFIVDQLNIFE